MGQTDTQSIALPTELPGQDADVARAGGAGQEAERWRPVAGHPTYEVSDLGRVRRATGGHGCRAGRLLKPKVGTGGYLQHCLSGGKRGAQRWIETHVLVARAFLGEPPEGQEVDHEDRDRTNARLSNLRYLTHAANMARKVCRSCGGEGHGHCGPRLTLAGASS
jgi:hypothetical protein